jgi:hypothetical protein
MEAIKQRLVRGFWFTLAVVFVVESWLWDHVKEWLRALARALGLERLEARLIDLLAPLSPLPTLAVFAVPAMVIFPLKLVAISMLAHGEVLAGIVVILTANVLALGVTGFLFDTCRDKLLQMPWFAKFYSIVLAVRAWADALVAPARQRLNEARQYIGERVAALLGESRSSFMRMLAQIRALSKRRDSA